MQLYCAGGLDTDMRCLKIAHAGAVLDITVNPQTRAVQVSVVKNDGDWFVKQMIYEHCAIVDAENWKCEEQFQKSLNGGWTETNGMYKGRFYRTGVGGIPPDFYDSSISGLAYWLVRFGVISLQSAQKI